MTGEVPAKCPHCRTAFAAPAAMAGGITNCPRCNKAVEVAGLRDPLWRLLQFGGAVVVGAVGWLVATTAGPVMAVLAMAATAALLWLLSRGL